MRFSGSLWNEGKLVVRKVEGDITIGEPVAKGAIPWNGEFTLLPSESLGTGEYGLVLDGGLWGTIVVTASMSSLTRGMVVYFTGSSSQ